jgi:hypothetical protein
MESLSRLDGKKSGPNLRVAHAGLSASGVPLSSTSVAGGLVLPTPGIGKCFLDVSAPSSALYALRLILISLFFSTRWWW